MVEKVNCVPYSAILSVEYCSQQHEKANTPEAIKNMWRQKCRRCPIGADCLGTDKYLERSVLFRSKICTRCQRQSIRLVRGVVCVSCYNRELENAKGLNKHGNPLRLIRHYHKAKVTFFTRDGESRQREFQKVLTEDEAARSVQLIEPEFIKIKSIVLVPIKSPKITKQRQKREKSPAEIKSQHFSRRQSRSVLIAP